MSFTYDPQRLDLLAFARNAGTLSGGDSLSHYPRLAADAQGCVQACRVAWQAQGELRQPEAVAPEVWLHLSAQAVLPLLCQRCLEVADIELKVQRSFRFADDETQAAVLDEASEDDVLVLSRDFNLAELVEDELLLALPLVPLHEACPSEPKMYVADATFDEQVEVKPHPFAGLAGLQRGVK
jgi:uncharacterized protein